EVGAARARLGTLGPEHEAVDRERVLARCEQFRESHASGAAAGASALEDIVFRDCAALGQRATLGGDALDVPPQLHLLLEQGIAGLSIDLALVGELQVFKVLVHAAETTDSPIGLPQR